MSLLEKAVTESSIGIVVIGRNEGERLRRCLASISRWSGQVVYVDSASTDGSVATASALGVDIVELDMSVAFTAARARNAGFRRLREIFPGVTFVQFIDGDCTIIEGWVEHACHYLLTHPTLACVCGCLREHFPERSVYNRLCDREWSRPTGATEACGGIAVMRADLFAAIGGFREDLVAGEEPELCRRFRSKGFGIWRLDQSMALHDANMLHFGQWWKRSKRVGFGYAQACWLHGKDLEMGELRRLLRPWFWTIGVPLAAAAATAFWGWQAIALWLVYPLGIWRSASKEAGSWGWRLTYASFLMLGKLPEWVGEWQFWLGQARGKASSVSFDYKR